MTRKLLIGLIFGWAGAAFGSEFEWATDINPGDKFPAFELSAQDGEPLSLASLGAENGYLIQFNRSVVW